MNTFLELNIYFAVISWYNIYMESVEEIRDYVLADMIHEVENMTREQLVRELINLKAEKIEALKNPIEIINYGRQKSKN